MPPIAPISPSGRRPASPDPLAARILDIIRRDGPITAADIAERLPILTDDPIRTIRKKVRGLIISNYQPIASSMKPPYGYFVIRESDSDAVQAYVEQLTSRMSSMAQRLARFRSATADLIQQALFAEKPGGRS